MQRIPRRALKGVSNIHVGMQLQAQSDRGPRAVTVTQVAGDMVTIDGNHPLAGQNLNFEVEVADVRAATEEEFVARPRPRAGWTSRLEAVSGWR